MNDINFSYDLSPITEICKKTMNNGCSDCIKSLQLINCDEHCLEGDTEVRVTNTV